MYTHTHTHTHTEWSILHTGEDQTQRRLTFSSRPQWLESSCAGCCTPLWGPGILLNKIHSIHSVTTEGSQPTEQSNCASCWGHRILLNKMRSIHSVTNEGSQPTEQSNCTSCWGHRILLNKMRSVHSATASLQERNSIEYKSETRMTASVLYKLWYSVLWPEERDFLKICIALSLS